MIAGMAKARVDQHERLNRLLTMVAERGRVEVETAAVDLGVSAATVRRDLDQLAEQQLVARTHGGAVSSNSSYDLPLRYKTARRMTEKQRIGVAAASMVTAGQVVAINGGTTCLEVARAIGTRGELAGSPRPGAQAGAPATVTVLTNALNIATELVVWPQIQLVLTGGMARPQSYELFGPLAEAALAEVVADIAFIGVDAVDPTLGACGHHPGEAAVNRRLVGAAGRVAVVADSSKIGRRAFARICPTDEIDVLITDGDAPADVLAEFIEAGVDVRTV